MLHPTIHQYLSPTSHHLWLHGEPTGAVTVFRHGSLPSGLLDRCSDCSAANLPPGADGVLISPQKKLQASWVWINTY